MQDLGYSHPPAPQGSARAREEQGQSSSITAVGNVSLSFPSSAPDETECSLSSLRWKHFGSAWSNKSTTAADAVEAGLGHFPRVAAPPLGFSSAFPWYQYMHGKRKSWNESIVYPLIHFTSIHPFHSPGTRQQQQPTSLIRYKIKDNFDLFRPKGKNMRSVMSFRGATSIPHPGRNLALNHPGRNM